MQPVRSQHYVCREMKENYFKTGFDSCVVHPPLAHTAGDLPQTMVIVWTLPWLLAPLRKRYGRRRVARHMCISLSWHDKRRASGMERRSQLLLTQSDIVIDCCTVYYSAIITLWISTPQQIKKEEGQDWRRWLAILMFSDFWFGLICSSAPA